MATVLKYISKNKINENKKFGITCVKYEFFLLDSIEVCEWPLAFSEYIMCKISENHLPTDHIGILIDQTGASGRIPFVPLAKLTPALFQEHFEIIFHNVEKQLYGSLSVEVTYVTPPSFRLMNLNKRK